MVGAGEYAVGAGEYAVGAGGACRRSRSTGESRTSALPPKILGSNPKYRLERNPIFFRLVYQQRLQAVSRLKCGNLPVQAQLYRQPLWLVLVKSQSARWAWRKRKSVSIIIYPLFFCGPKGNLSQRTNPSSPRVQTTYTIAVAAMAAAGRGQTLGRSSFSRATENPLASSSGAAGVKLGPNGAAFISSGIPDLDSKQLLPISPPFLD
jgi:hypothetical protein